MPKMPKDPSEDAFNKLEKAAESIVAGDSQVSPTVFCGVNRKVNIGNFENVDVYFGLTVPIYSMPKDEEGVQQFQAAISEASEFGFMMASKETAERYNKIKDMKNS